MNNLECRKQGFNKWICKRTGKEILLVQCKNCPYKKYKTAKNCKKLQKCTIKHEILCKLKKELANLQRWKEKDLACLLMMIPNACYVDLLTN